VCFATATLGVDTRASFGFSTCVRRISWEQTRTSCAIRSHGTQFTNRAEKPVVKLVFI
jgi:hypothetical protein